ncbi:MAG: flagellar FliJ family protein [Anaeromyxobacter sp.]
MTVDLRGFEYELEPVRKQRQWQLEAVQAELGRVQRALEQAVRRVEELRAQHEEQGRCAARALQAKVDPGAYATCLRWLAQLRDGIAGASVTVAELEAERTQVLRSVLEHQQRVDVIEKHRDERQAEFVRDALARSARENDQEWLSRRHASRGGRGAGPGERQG